MADKTVTARLRTTYDSKGTDAAAKGLRGLGDQAKKTSQTIGRDWAATGKSMASFGDSMTAKVSLPLIGLGALATKAAADFDASFTTMSTLAGVSQEAIAGLKDEILTMAGEVGKSPQELADAYYFLASSGLEAAEAMDALEVSAKASAAGLGPTEVIADAVSSAMLGYAESGLEAAEATDVLIATAKAGKAEPAELAAQMGRLIPTAAELGITFADVGGAIAALSTKGNDAAGATTQLTNVMGKLMKPSQQAEEALQNVGLSTERIRELIAEKGLLGTLEVLKERLGDSGFAKFFEDQQAIQGALALTGGDLEKTRDIFEDVNDSVGATDKAFETWAESMGAKNARAFADFQVALIRLGEVIAPIASDLMSFAADVIGRFAELPDPVQKLALAFAAVAAAVGPLMSVGGRAVSAFSTAMKVFDNFTRSGGKAFADAMNAGTEATNNLGTGMSGVGKAASLAAGAAGVGALLFAIDEMGDAAHNARVADLVEDFMATKDAAESVTPAVEGNKFAYGEMADVFDTLLEQNPELAQQYLDQAEALGLSKDMVESAQAAIDRKTDAEVNATTAAQEHQAEVEGSVEALADEEQAVNEAAEAYKNYADTIRAAVDPVFGLLNSLRQNDQAQRDVRESLAKLNEVRADSEATAADVTAAEVAYQDALINVGTTAADVTTAAANLNAAVAENPALLDQALGALQTWREQGLIPTDEQLQFLQRQLEVTALEGVALGEVDPRVDVTETGGRRTREELAAVRDRAHDIPTRRNTRVSTSGTGETVRTLGDVIALVGSLPRSRTITVNAVLNDPHGIKQAALSGRRARGGPVLANRLYEVAENNKHEMFESEGHRYLLPGAKGQVIPIGPMTSGAALAGGGGGDTFVFHIGVVGNQRQFDQMVQKAFNTRLRKGRGLNAA